MNSAKLTSKKGHPFLEAIPQYKGLCKEILNTQYISCNVVIFVVIFVGRHMETMCFEPIFAQQRAMA
jgi:hypothetical protein